MFTGSLHVLSTRCKLNFTILTCIINKIIIFFPVYLQIFQNFCRKDLHSSYTYLPVIFGLFIGVVVKATTWHRVAGSHLGCDAVIILDLLYSFIGLFLVRLICASATALRGRQNAQKNFAIFGQLF